MKERGRGGREGGWGREEGRVGVIVIHTLI